MLWILIGMVLALAIYVGYKAMTPEGMNWKAGMAALVAFAGAVWAWFVGVFQSAPPV